MNMKKITPVTILLLLFILWYLSREWMGTSFYNLSSWGVYALIVPLVYCFLVLFSKRGSTKQKIGGVLSATIGVMITIFLDRLSFVENYALMKAAMTLLGATLCIVAIVCSNRCRLSKENM